MTEHVCSCKDCGSILRDTALYRIYALDGSLLYVGVTLDLGRRMQEHVGKPWYPLMHRLTAQWYSSRQDALDAEERAIKTEHPKWNIVHNSRSYF